MTSNWSARFRVGCRSSPEGREIIAHCHTALAPSPTVMFGGVAGKVPWAGSAPGLTAGATRINLQMLADLPACPLDTNSAAALVTLSLGRAIAIHREQVQPIAGRACRGHDVPDPWRGREEREGCFGRAQAAEAAPAPRAIDFLHD